MLIVSPWTVISDNRLACFPTPDLTVSAPLWILSLVVFEPVLHPVRRDGHPHGSEVAVDFYLFLYWGGWVRTTNLLVNRREWEGWFFADLA